MTLLSIVSPLLFVGLQVQQQDSTTKSNTDSLLIDATLSNCTAYALAHQPLIKQSLLDEAITESTIKNKLADWYPQINANYTLTNNTNLSQSYSTFFNNGNGGIGVIGIQYSSVFGLNATQNILNKEAIFASRTKKDARKQTKQTTAINKINLVADVTKAFYAVLLSQRQVDVLDADIVRLQKSLGDTKAQYAAGTVDNTDYKRATIALNTAQAQRTQMVSLIPARITYLKQLMGYPQVADLTLKYDSTTTDPELFEDSTLHLVYENRIEYQRLQTQLRLQNLNTSYYKWNFVPTVALFGNYNYSGIGHSFSKLYEYSFPVSNFGATVTLPIFQGGKRITLLHQSKLQVARLQEDLESLKNSIYTEYATALSIYKGNLANYYAVRDNEKIASEVYETIRQQYTSGVKTYLDVIIAESDLRTVQINFFDAFFQLLQSKVDVARALGNINAK